MRNGQRDQPVDGVANFLCLLLPILFRWLQISSDRNEYPYTVVLIPHLSSMANTKETQSGGAREREVTVQNKMGIHARPAAMIVRASNKYSNVEVWVEKDGEVVNGKSIMGLMMLAAGQGSKLTFKAEGEGSEELLDELQALFDQKFEEA